MFQFSAKIIESFVLSSYLGIRLLFEISEVFSKVTKFPVVIVSGDGDELFLHIT